MVQIHTTAQVQITVQDQTPEGKADEFDIIEPNVAHVQNEQIEQDRPTHQIERRNIHEQIDEIRLENHMSFYKNIVELGRRVDIIQWYPYYVAQIYVTKNFKMPSP